MGGAVMLLSFVAAGEKLQYCTNICHKISKTISWQEDCFCNRIITTNIALLKSLILQTVILHVSQSKRLEEKWRALQKEHPAILF